MYFLQRNEPVRNGEDCLHSLVLNFVYNKPSFLKIRFYNLRDPLRVGNKIPKCPVVKQVYEVSVRIVLFKPCGFTGTPRPESKDPGPEDPALVSPQRGVLRPPNG